MIEDPSAWQILDRVVQWLILPALAFVWAINQRVSNHDKEILRILTILEERNRRREDDKEEVANIYRQLHDAIEKLADRIERVVK